MQVRYLPLVRSVVVAALCFSGLLPAPVNSAEQSRAADIYWQMINANNAKFRYGAVKVPPPTQPARTFQFGSQSQPQNPVLTSQDSATKDIVTASANDISPATSRSPLWGVITEIRGGVLSHDVLFPDRHDLRWPNPFNNDRESGVDINGEALFESPDFLDILFSPRPHTGLMINTVGDTSSAYAGLTWDGKWDTGIFLEGFFGMAVHTGKLRNGNPDRIEFGSRALFRLGGEVGWRWWDTHGVSLIWDHMSNGSILSSKNQGIDNIGIRYGYNFSH